MRLIPIGFSLFFVLATSSFARETRYGDWQTIHPLNYCETLPIQFRTVDRRRSNIVYEVKIPIRRNGEIVDHHQLEIYDISNLNQIIKRLERAAVGYCHDYNREMINQLRTYPGARPVYSNNLVTVFETILQKLEQTQMQCRSVADYRELQDHVEQLQSRALNYHDNTNAWQAIWRGIGRATSDDREMVDQFYACGGRRHSDVFVENMIITGAREQCIMPTPPGLLDWDEVRSIAHQIAQNYRRTAGFRLKSKKEEILQRATLAFTKAALARQINELFTEESHPQQILSQLESFKTLDAINLQGNELTDYIALVFAPNISLELTQLALPMLIERNFDEQMPENLTDEEKQRLLRQLKAQAKHELHVCVEQQRQRLNGEGQMSLEQMLQHRKELKENYCLSYPAACSDNACESNINLVSNNPEIQDGDFLQACAMNALMSAIPSLINAAISAQTERFTNLFLLTPEIRETFTRDAWQEMRSCISTHTERFNSSALFPSGGSAFTTQRDGQAIGRSEIGADLLVLASMNQEQFKQVIASCSSIPTLSVMRNAIEQGIYHNEAFIRAFAPRPDDHDSIAFNDINLNDTHREMASRIVNEAYDPCISRLRELETEDDSPQIEMCRPLIEIKSASLITARQLDNAISEFRLVGIYRRRALQIKEEFLNCSQNSIELAQQSLGNSDSTHPLLNIDQATQYLDSDSSYYQCTKNALSQIAGVIAQVKYERIIRQRQSDLAAYDAILRLSIAVKNRTANCFRRELPSRWSAFRLVLDTEEGIAHFETQCYGEVLTNTLPQVLTLESQAQLNGLQQQNILSNTEEMNSILRRITTTLKERYQLSLQVTAQADIDLKNTLRLAYARYRTSHGDDAIDEFIEEFTHDTLDATITHLREKINQLISRGNPLDPVTRRFRQVVSVDCLRTIYQKLREAPNVSSNSDSQTNPSLERISNMIRAGLQYAKRIGHEDNAINRFRSLCQNANDIRNIDDILRSGSFNYIIEAQLHERTSTQFTGVVDRLYQDDIDTIDAIMRRLSSIRPSSLRSTLKGKLEAFAENRKNRLRTLVRSEITRPNKFHQMIERNPSILRYASANLLQVINDTSSEQAYLKSLLVESLFRSRTPESFADQFAQINLEASIGINGIERARNSALSEADNAIRSSSLLPNSLIPSAQTEAQEELIILWTPQNIQRGYAWTSRTHTNRQELIAAIYEHAVLPATSDNLSNSEKETHRQSLNAIVELSTQVQAGGQSFQSYIKENVNERVSYYDILTN